MQSISGTACTGSGGNLPPTKDKAAKPPRNQNRLEKKAVAVYELVMGRPINKAIIRTVIASLLLLAALPSAASDPVDEIGDKVITPFDVDSANFENDVTKVPECGDVYYDLRYERFEIGRDTTFGERC